MSSRGNEVRVGAVTLVALLLLAAAVLWVGGFRPGRQQVGYRVRLANINGLETGAAVRYGGHRVGEIRRASVASDDPSRIELEFDVDPETPVRQGSRARVNQVGLLADPFLEILPADPSAPPLEPGGLLAGRETRSIGDLVDGLAGLSVRAEVSLTKIEEALDLLVPKADRVLVAFDDMLTEENREHLASLLRAFDELAPQLGSVSVELERTLRELDPLLDEAAGLGSELRDTLPSIEHFTDSGGDVFDLVLEHRDELAAAIDRLEATLVAVEGAAGEAHGFLAENREDLEELLVRMKATLRYLESFSEAVARRPSSLVWSGKRELKEEGRKEE